jgi:hypothetical protein
LPPAATPTITVAADPTAIDLAGLQRLGRQDPSRKSCVGTCRGRGLARLGGGASVGRRRRGEVARWPAGSGSVAPRGQDRRGEIAGRQRLGSGEPTRAGGLSPTFCKSTCFEDRSGYLRPRRYALACAAAPVSAASGTRGGHGDPPHALRARLGPSRDSRRLGPRRTGRGSRPGRSRGRAPGPVRHFRIPSGRRRTDENGAL